MTASKSPEGTGDDFIFLVCPNTNNSYVYINIQVTGLAAFANRLKLYSDVPAAKQNDSIYFLSRLQEDVRENRIGISDIDAEGVIKITFSRAYFAMITAAGGKFEQEGKKIVHSGVPTEVTKVASILQVNRKQESKKAAEVPAGELDGVVFMTCKDNRFLSRLGVAEIYLPATDMNFAMVVQALSMNRVEYSMDYHGLTVSGIEPISAVVAMGGQFTGSEQMLGLASNMYRAA